MEKGQACASEKGRQARGHSAYLLIGRRGRGWSEWSLPASFTIYPKTAPIYPKDSLIPRGQVNYWCPTCSDSVGASCWRRMWRCHLISSMPLSPGPNGRDIENYLLSVYLVFVVEDYFRDRWLEYRDKSGLLCEGHAAGVRVGPSTVECRHLRTALPPSAATCYTDDTLVMMTGRRNWGSRPKSDSCEDGSIILSWRVSPRSVARCPDQKRRHPRSGLNIWVSTWMVVGASSSTSW